jgi:hypothetical protein
MAHCIQAEPVGSWVVTVQAVMCAYPDIFIFVFVDVGDLIAAYTVAVVRVCKAGELACFLVEPVNAAFKSAYPDISPAILQDIYYAVVAETVRLGTVAPVIGESSGFDIVFINTMSIRAKPHILICILHYSANVIS